MLLCDGQKRYWESKMPLIQGYTDASIAANIRKEMEAGKTREQAVAIAYRVAEKARERAGKA